MKMVGHVNTIARFNCLSLQEVGLKLASLVEFTLM